MIQQVRSNQNQSSHYNPLTSTEKFVHFYSLLFYFFNKFSQRYQAENYPNTSSIRRGSNLIRQPSYITAVRSNDQPDFGKI